MRIELYAVQLINIFQSLKLEKRKKKKRGGGGGGGAAKRLQLKLKERIGGNLDQEGKDHLSYCFLLMRHRFFVGLPFNVPPTCKVYLLDGPAETIGRAATLK